jgi:hypothetical protein
MKSLFLLFPPTPHFYALAVVCCLTYPGLSDGLSAVNNVQTPLPFALAFFNPPSQPTLPAASTSHYNTTHFAARASVEMVRILVHVSPVSLLSRPRLFFVS